MYLQEEAVSCYCSASHTDNNYSTDEHEHDSIREGAGGTGVVRGGLQLSDSGADLSECGGDTQYTSSTRHDDWERYWSANGERIIWQSWIAKYGEYINPGYLNRDGTTLSESNGVLPEDGPVGQIKDPSVDDSSKLKTNQCSIFDEQHTAFQRQESTFHSLSSTFQSSFQNSFPRGEGLSKNIPSPGDLEINVELPSKNLLDDVDNEYSGPATDKTELQGSFELTLPAITKTDAESKNEDLLTSPAGEPPEKETKQDMLMCNSDINPADRWSPLSPSSTDDSSGDGSADDNIMAGSVANTALTSDSMTNVTKITVSSLDFSCGDMEDSVNSSSLSSSSAGSGSVPCVTDEADQYWQELWKQHFNEQYYAHYNAFLAWEQKEGNEEPEAIKVETSDTNQPTFQLGEESSSAKQNSFHEMEPDMGNGSASCVKDDINLNFVENYYSTNDISLAASNIVTNDLSHSGEIEFATKRKSWCSEVEDLGKEYERNLSCSCSLTVTEETLEHTQTLPFEEDILSARRMELNVETDQSIEELNKSQGQVLSELDRKCCSKRQHAVSLDEDSSNFGKMELSPGTDHSFGELDHEKQHLIPVSSSDMVMEDKECDKGSYSVTNVVQESLMMASTESHLPPIPKRASGRRGKSR